MTKQATAPPTRDQGTPTAPPAPPAWRHYLWLIAALIFVLLFFVLPTTSGQKQVSLTYSQFLKDVSGNKVKTVTIATSGSATGTLKDGKSYTTAIPPQAQPTVPVKSHAPANPLPTEPWRHVQVKSHALANPLPTQ